MTETSEKKAKRFVEEDYLHYVWKYRLFNQPILMTVNGHPVQVLDPGQHNQLGGPDFLHARLRIGEQIWNGHVEIHVRASDWMRHGHESDPHYKNIILHVVLFADKEISLFREGDLEVVELGSYLLPEQYDKYIHWKSGNRRIPCSGHLQETDEMMWFVWKERLLIERLESREENILQEVSRCSGDWNEAFYRRLFRSFGMKWNDEAMYSLAVSLPLSILLRNLDDRETIECLLFGQAGMLNEVFADVYPETLRRHYYHHQAKYNLSPLAASVWQYGRIRPVNFPGIRLAQLASILAESKITFDKIRDIQERSEIVKIFRTPASPYWDNHYRFDHHSAQNHSRRKNAGEDLVNTVIVNTICPFLFTYGKARKIEVLQERALSWLLACPPEINAITREWKKFGVSMQNAWDSQALIQLYNVYCTSFSCLRCMAGHDILKKRSS